MVNLIKVVRLILCSSIWLKKVKADCANGPNLPSAGSQLTFGANDASSCSTHLNSYETDTCSKVWIGGTTYSGTIAGTGAACLS